MTMALQQYGVYLAAFMLFFLISQLVQRWRRASSSLPGPWITKWTYLLATFYWLTGRKAKWVHQLHEKYGPVVRIAPDDVDICDIDAAREIYSVKETFVKSSFYKRFAPQGVVNIFFATDVSQHRRYRRLLSNPMSEGALRQMCPVVEEKVSLAINGMQAEMQRRGAADSFKWWLFMATDVIGELSFGEPFRMLEQGEKNQYTFDLEGVGWVGAIRASFPAVVHAARVLPLPVFRDAAAAAQRMFGYATESLRRHYDAPGDKATLFSKLYRAEEDDALTMTEIRANALAYIIAGSDTTATTLTYLVWAVCRHQSVRDTLVQELAGLPDTFGDADLKQIPYLGCVIDESLRLYGAAPSTFPRVVPAGGATLAGHYFEGGTIVSSQAYSLHRDPTTFPDPDTFRPERWKMPTKAMKDAFFAFGGGARVCLGMHLARMELRLATARFFRTFPGARVSTLEGMSDDDMAPKIYLLLSPSGKRCLLELW